ncbi:MAG: site-specific DNA-methyltransferase [Candidatus Micrarchaeota archaeon]|nr:site-specific DNA-methyltransferase [Candidatus Micrarchaeota archaeon]
MLEITEKDYVNFIEGHKEVIIENSVLEIGKKWEIKQLQPKDFKLETTTVWSFPERGIWATHYLNNKYRGNWAPQVPRNIILRYSKEGDTVLDAFSGSGTTAIECVLTNRNSISVDVNKEACFLTMDRIQFRKQYDEFTNTIHKVFCGDARNLKKIGDEMIDLIATHPPYANIISYTQKSKEKVDGDLSKVTSINEFAKEMEKVAKEFYRVLKPGKYCAILMGDTRRHGHFVPVTVKVLQSFLNAGFILKEDVIKLQHKMFGTIKWRKRNNNFLLIAHEHLFIFRKPEKGESLSKFKEII